MKMITSSTKAYWTVDLLNIMKWNFEYTKTGLKSTRSSLFSFPSQLNSVATFVSMLVWSYFLLISYGSQHMLSCFSEGELLPQMPELCSEVSKIPGCGPWRAEDRLKKDPGELYFFFSVWGKFARSF